MNQKWNNLKGPIGTLRGDLILDTQRDIFDTTEDDLYIFSMAWKLPRSNIFGLVGRAIYVEMYEDNWRDYVEGV